MIAVRIPEEIRKYKEKVALGLTARQVVATILAFLICVPLYYYGRHVIAEDILSWLIILIVLPFGAIGFIKINGMPMEQFFIVWFKFEILYPRKRKYKTENVFREWQNQAKKEEEVQGFLKRRKYLREQEKIAYEKTFLKIEAEEKRGEILGEIDTMELLTVSNSEKQKTLKNKSKNNFKKGNAKVKNKLEVETEKIIEKQKQDGNVILTNKERALLKKYNAYLYKLRKKEVTQGIKTVKTKDKEMKKRRKAKTVIPKTTQQTIPFIADYEEGLFEVSPNKYSKVYEIKDINYQTGKEEEKVNIFLKLGEFLNYFSDDMRFAFFIDNRIVSKSEQERKVFAQYTGAKGVINAHRKEHNRVLKRQILAGKNDMQLQKYVSVTIDANSPIDALIKFHKIDNEITQNLRNIGSNAKVLSTDERLELYHDKFRKGREGDFNINYDFIKKQGISSKDYIAPSFMNVDRKHIQIEDEFYRILYVSNLPASLQDDFLYDVYDNDFPVTVALNIEPVSQEKGLKIVKKQLAGIETNKIDAEKRAIKAGYSPETIQHSIKDAHAQAETLYDDMLNKNQKMFFVTITVMVHGKDLEELEIHSNSIINKARKYTTQIQSLNIQQEEGFKITMPFGYVSKELRIERALTTESTSIFMPFSNQELFQAGGFYYGLNQISQNLVIVNRTKMKTPSGFVLGSSGSGKSFATKREILNVLVTDDNTGVLIIDPENEYGDFCRAFEGTVLKISADSSNYINPLDMPIDYGLDEDDDENVSIEVKKDKALKKKSDYMMSIIEKMISRSSNGDVSTIEPQQKTIIDRCVKAVYKKYFDSNFDMEYIPTLLDLQDELDKERTLSEDGRLIAEGVEYYTRGSMNFFANKTNVEVTNRFVVFNVRDLGSQLKQIGLLIVFDFIWNRMIENKNKGVRTYCYCDEIHVMFQSYNSAIFLQQLYKRGRKYGLCITGLTQDVEDLLRCELARSMLSNSNFIMMLNQSSENLKLLSKMLSISETQMSFVTGADAGSGLLFAEKVIVPFVDHYPEDSYLYSLMSTRFGEDVDDKEMKEKLEEIMRSGADLEEDIKSLSFSS